MKTRYRMVKLVMVLICAAAIMVPGDRSWSDDGFFVIGGGGSSPWQRNGTSIYYTGGNVGIGLDNPSYLFHVSTTVANPVRCFSSASDQYTIRGTANATNTAGVLGINTFTGNKARGVIGETFSTDIQSYGVYGLASATTGSAMGVYGQTNSGNSFGVYGRATASTGTSKGVVGQTDSGWSTSAGVWGIASGNATGVWGQNVSGSGYGVYCEGDLAVTGEKNAIVPTSQGDKKLYSQESPEVWFEDFGEGQLKGGTARIELDPVFLETVTINDQHPLKVFIQLNDECNGVYVLRKTSGFEVKELRAGASGAHFTYRVVAKRKGFETARLEAAHGASNLAATKTPPAIKAPFSLTALQK